MLHYLIELAIWLLAAYFVGVFAGGLLRKIFTSNAEPVAASPDAVPARVARTPVEPAPPSRPAPAAPLAAAGKMERPRGIAAARDGKPDRLQRISGVGTKNEKLLHSLGFFHFDQIAAWTPEQIDWVDDHLKFSGRIKREEWTRQARLLADGKEDEFAKLFGTGGMRNRKGETQSGSRTRRT